MPRRRFPEDDPVGLFYSQRNFSRYASATIAAKKSAMRQFWLWNQKRFYCTLDELQQYLYLLCDKEYTAKTVAAKAANVSTDLLMVGGLTTDASGYVDPFAARRLDRFRWWIATYAQREDVRKAPVIFSPPEWSIFNSISEEDAWAVILFCLTGMRMASWCAVRATHTYERRDHNGKYNLVLALTTGL